MNSSQQLHSVSTLELDVPPMHRVTVSDRTFGVAAAQVWNGLPSDVITTPLLSVFKQWIKTLLFSHSFDVWLLPAWHCWFYFLFCFVKCSRRFFDSYGTLIIFVSNNNNTISTDQASCLMGQRRWLVHSISALLPKCCLSSIGDAKERQQHLYFKGAVGECRRCLLLILVNNAHNRE